MHRALLEANLKLVRQRHAEGDCPITRALPTETLEFMVLALADDLADVRGLQEAMLDDGK